jgi:hypothetical protein
VIEISSPTPGALTMRAISSVRWARACSCPTVLAAMNKCLAQNNKSRDGGKATKKRENGNQC